MVTPSFSKAKLPVSVDKGVVSTALFAAKRVLFVSVAPKSRLSVWLPTLNDS